MTEIMREMKVHYIEEIREQRPLVHCITNAVTVNACANLLLAAGASPTMAHHPAEVTEVTSACRALVCNLGATEYFDAMLLAASHSTKLGHPIIVDPVGVGGSALRREFFKELAGKSRIACVRGNYAEIAALVEDANTIAGVDAGDGFEKSIVRLAKKLAQKIEAVVIASGAIDVVTDGDKVCQVENGDARMSQITGSGCMSSALLGAYFAVAQATVCTQEVWEWTKEDAKQIDKVMPQSLGVAAEAMAAMGICGEFAAKRCEQEGSGTMSFQMHLIDEMSLLDEKSFTENQRIIWK